MASCLCRSSAETIMSQEDERWIRALQKKLRQIDELKARRNDGHTLIGSQQQKLEREAFLRKQLVEATASQQVGRQEVQTTVEEHSLVVGGRLKVDGHKAKVRKLSDAKVCVKFRSGSREWLQLPADSGRISDVRPPKGSPEKETETEEEAFEPGSAPTKAAARVPSAPALARAPLPMPSPRNGLVGLSCTHCGQRGHMPRVCSFGLVDTERFLFCSRTTPTACFPRIFVVPLRRAAEGFDTSNLRDGRVDVGLRCVSAGLFRSQSLRQNSQVVLCFGGDGRVEQATPKPRIITVCGSMVRDLRPDETSLALRLRAVSDAAGAAAAERERQAAREQLASAGGGPVTDDAGALGKWSRGETRGLLTSDGSWLDALRSSLAAPASPPLLLLLNADGQFIGELCDELATASKAPAGVVVLLGDDRGLSASEEHDVLQLAAQRGADVRRVSLGQDVLFASHSIVLVHHYLDRTLHSCAVRPPRVLVRGGGGGGRARGRGRGHAHGKGGGAAAPGAGGRATYGKP
jgi:tRNA pseudouridine-54 N-methylase